MTTTDVDVIVLDLDGGAMLRDCLGSIHAQSVPPRRIVVFDNGSRVPVEVPGAVILRSDTNLGFARGVNEAFARTSAPYVALINNDVVLDRDWLATVRDALDRDERLAAVQTLIRRPDGLLDGAGIDISDGTYRQIGHAQPVGAPLAVPWGVSATATLYRRAALGARVFDERFFAYYEDVELCARLRRDGWRLAVLPFVEATHRGSATGAKLGARALRLRTRNRYFVARLHRGVGRIRALLWEDARLALRGRTSPRGVVEGLWSRL
ncbi:MAG: glycosyltransferase family 2 protein [Acidobacteria bacterium]|nr:glycosyltransferase family 2 protein [Acidobacteriota bacterium]MBV9476521.1 glycosyltransferase family 2 protein [Acidobacteriota bacterium]